MRSSLLAVAVAVCLLLVVSAASAQSYVSVWDSDAKNPTGTSSWFGNVGLVVTPTAQSPGPSEGTIQWHRVDRDAGDVDVFGANFGVTNWLELGGAYVDDDAINDGQAIANAKFIIPIAKWLKEPGWPALAAGVVDLSNELNRAYYFVLTKTFSAEEGYTGLARNLKLSVGIADNDSECGPLDGLFGGIEFAAFNHALVQAEYDGDAFNCALRYKWDRVSIDVGLLDGDLGFGLTYCSSF